MRQRMTILVALVFLMAAGGMMTSLLSGRELADVLPFLEQTSNREASTLYAEAWQTEQLFLMIGFIVFNMVGIAATIAVIIWFLNRGVTQVQAEAENRALAESSDEA